MQAGLKEAIEIPMAVMRLAASCWPHLVTLAEYGNITAVSDVQVCMPRNSWKLFVEEGMEKKLKEGTRSYTIFYDGMTR